jgi:hypothetical protein
LNAFFSENLSTVLIGGAVFGVLFFALVRTIRNYRRGKSPCGCENCPKAKHDCG